MRQKVSWTAKKAGGGGDWAAREGLCYVKYGNDVAAAEASRRYVLLSLPRRDAQSFI